MIRTREMTDWHHGVSYASLLGSLLLLSVLALTAMGCSNSQQAGDHAESPTSKPHIQGSVVNPEETMRALAAPSRLVILSEIAGSGQCRR